MQLNIGAHSNSNATGRWNGTNVIRPSVPRVPPLGTVVDAQHGVRAPSVLSHALSNGTFQSGWSYHYPSAVLGRPELFHLERPLVVRLGNNRRRCPSHPRMICKEWIDKVRMKTPQIATLLDSEKSLHKRKITPLWWPLL